MTLVHTPSQTVGPFFGCALPIEAGNVLVDENDPDAVRIAGTLFDGEDGPVPDGMIEVWQANRHGRYAHPEDLREDVPLEEGFTGWGRCGTGDDGDFSFVTVKPGPVPDPDGGWQAPHIDVAVFARGLLKHLVTRIYFPDEAEANALDKVLSSIEDEQARCSLVAASEGGGLRFDIHLQGAGQTAFFDV